jgi:hypothetical protein
MNFFHLLSFRCSQGWGFKRGNEALSRVSWKTAADMLRRTSHFFALFSPLAASAHPGHTPCGIPVVHLLTSAEHLGVVLVIAVILFCVVRALRRTSRARN